MELAKDHHHTSSRSFYENMLKVGSTVQFPQISPYEFDDYNHQHEDGLESPNSTNNKVMMNNNNNNNSQVISNSTSLSSSSSANSSNNGFTIHHNPSNYQPHEEANSLLTFKSSYGNFIHTSNNNNGSLLSFQNDDQIPITPETYQKLGHPIDHHTFPIWEGSSSTSMHHQQNHFKEMKNVSSNLHLLEDVGGLRSSSGDYHDAANEWLYAAEANAGDPQLDSPTQRTCFNKRPNMEEENMQVPNKKQCTSKKPSKPKSSPNTKDPQSVAAKNRRERISERLKILQDLVPNGSKVDLVTMLEKAIGYVKFLQLQVKVLATDEFWPAAGGKAPDITQVREAIDAILLSQRTEGTSSGGSK